MKALSLALSMLLLSAVNVAAATRDASLINSFQVLCALEAPVFDSIDKRATAMRLPVRRDLRTPSGGGPSVAHAKSWLMLLTTGPHELLASEADGPAGHIESCGISAPDPNGESFKKELTATMKLGQPSSTATSPDGVMRTTIWKEAYGTGTWLQMVDATPQNKPGVMLYFFVQRASQH